MLDIPQKNYVYGKKFNTYIKHHTKTILILIHHPLDDIYVFNLLSNLYKTDYINQLYFQVITIPSSVKIYYDGSHYYCNNVNIKKKLTIEELVNNPLFTENIIKNRGMSIQYLDICSRTNTLMKLAIQNDINSIVYCQLYDNLSEELYKNPDFIYKMYDNIPLHILTSLSKKRNTKKYFIKDSTLLK